MAAFLSFLASVPALISLISEILAFIKKISGNDPAGFALKLGQAFSQLNAAQTQEDHSNAAKALADVIGHLPAK